MAQRSTALAAAGRSVESATPERLQVTQRRVALEHNVAAVPAVAAVRSAARHVRLTAEAGGSGAAGPRLDLDPGFVVKHPPILAESEPHVRRSRFSDYRRLLRDRRRHRPRRGPGGTPARAGSPLDGPPPGACRRAGGGRAGG